MPAAASRALTAVPQLRAGSALDGCAGGCCGRPAACWERLRGAHSPPCWAGEADLRAVAAGGCCAAACAASLQEEPTFKTARSNKTNLPSPHLACRLPAACWLSSSCRCACWAPTAGRWRQRSQHATSVVGAGSRGSGGGLCQPVGSAAAAPAVQGAWIDVQACRQPGCCLLALGAHVFPSCRFRIGELRGCL